MPSYENLRSAGTGPYSRLTRCPWPSRKTIDILHVVYRLEQVCWIFRKNRRPFKFGRNVRDGFLRNIAQHQGVVMLGKGNQSRIIVFRRCSERSARIHGAAVQRVARTPQRESRLLLRHAYSGFHQTLRVSLTIPKHKCIGG